MSRTVFVLVCLLLSSQLFADEKRGADDGSNREAETIEMLIVAVETSGCTFIRNNKRHSAGQAADHLRLKLRRGKRYATTAEDFIENLASKSSWSGKPYVMDCPGSEQQSVNQWLRERLDTVRETLSQDQTQPGN